ncbi:MAG: hypothetical protein U0132_15950 [Gemmatimonadaceae bacterium]
MQALRSVTLAPRHLIHAFLLLAGLSCAGPRGDDAGKDSTSARISSTGADQDGDRERVLASQGLARRVGDTLVLTLRGRQSARLVHDTTGTDNSMLYAFDGHLSHAPFFGIRVSYFEGSGYLIVHDSTGRQTQLDAPPLVSPSGRLIATASIDLVAAFDPTRLFVASLNGDTLRTEFELSPEDWGPDSLQWQGEDTLRFVQRLVTEEPGVYRSQPAQLIRSATGWRLVSTHP